MHAVQMFQQLLHMPCTTCPRRAAAQRLCMTHIAAVVTLWLA